MEHAPVLKKTALFSGISAEETVNLLHCLNAKTKRFKKGDYILFAGEETRDIGVLLSGQAAVYRDDILGNRSMLGLVSPADMFAESFLCAGLTTSPVTVEAGADSDVLLLPFERIIKTCSSCCGYHNALIENMLGIIAKKNLSLSDKIDHIAKRTTRQKVASYLLSQATANGSKSFSIGLDRQALADYLCVNRSALSRELSKIAEERILSFHKDSFNILDFERLESVLHSEQAGNRF